MAGNRSKMAGGDWRTLFLLGTMGDWPDGRLLDRFLQQPDDGGDAAFETIVRRHGPMVWHVCRGVLSDRHAAEDAYQATFLVLAERAASIRRRESVASWLYGVARRISLRSLADARHRRDSERRAARPEAVAVPPLADAPGDLEALLREVDRLPAHYRGPIALHDLGGCSYEEVAARLGCPVGTIKARLNRGRALLRSRLAARGASPTLPAPAALAGIVPNALTERTVRSAVSLLLGRAATGAGVASLSPTVAALARGVIHAMFLAKLKTTAAALVLGTGLCAAGAAAVVMAQGSPPGSPPESASRTPSPAPNRPTRQEPTLSPEAIDQRAEEIATSLDDPARRAEVLLRLGRARIQRERFEEALDALRLARQAAEEIPADTRIIPHPIFRIAEAQADAGDREAALETFRAAIAIVEAMEIDQQRNEWSNLIASWNRALGRDRFFEVAEPYIMFHERNDVERPTVTMVQVQALSGKVAEAFNAVKTSAPFQGPEKAVLRRRALLAMTDALRPEDGALIDEVLAEVSRAVRAGAEPQPEEFAPDDLIQAQWMAASQWVAVARNQARLGRFDEALDTTRAAAAGGDAAEVTKINQAQVFIVIAEEQLDAGDREGARKSADEAMQVIETIEDRGMIPIPKEMAARLYLKVGAIEEAEALVADLVEQWGIVGEAWLGLAEARREAGDVEDARAILRMGLEKTEAVLPKLLDQPPAEGDRPSGPDPLIGSTNQIVQAATNLARIRLKLDGVRTAIETAAQLPEKARSEFLPDLAGLLAEDRKLDAARGVIQSIDDPELRDRAIFRVALAMPGPSEAEPPASPEPDEAP